MQSSDKFSDDFRSFFIAFKLFGLSPFSENGLLSFALVLYSGVLLCGVLVTIASAFLWAQVFENSISTLAAIVGRLVICGLTITAVFILLQAVIFRQEHQQILDRFDDINHTLKNKLSVNVNNSKLWRKFAYKIIGIVIILIAVIVINFVCLDYFDENAANLFHCLPSIIIIRARCIQNILLVDLIDEHLHLVNQKLEEIITNKKDNLNAILFVKKFQSTDFRHIKRPVYDEILILKDIYGKIWDITNLINDAFGWSLLAVATQNFIEFTCNGYWLFLAVVNLISDIAAINAVCTVLPVVFVLANMAYSCYCCTETGKKTGGLVHKIEKDISDELHNALVREFSLQIAHEPITISANGFFNIDFSLLGSMAAATVTYLVILIQFQLSEKNKGNSTTTM